MGIIVDLGKSGIVFDEPLVLARKDADPRELTFGYDMLSWKTTFALGFDPDPKVGAGGAPKAAEMWTVGIVQNLLYERYLFTYFDRPPIAKEFRHATVDATDSSHDYPFYSSPAFGKQRDGTGAVRQVWLTSNGYGDLLDSDPGNPTGVRVTNTPRALTMYDQPSGGVNLFRDGRLLDRVEKVLAFQQWVVARQGSKTQVLATMPAFTVVFWWKGTGPPEKFEPMPQFEYGVYGINGFSPSKAAKVDETQKSNLGSIPNLQPMAGNGGLAPVLTGPTSLNQARQFLKDNKLHM
jgi:hypothetical protein